MTRPSTTSRRRKEKEDRKEAILAAAREVFFEEGIRRATVDQIAARAEVAKGTVYLYFETRETILAHILLEGLDELNRRLEAAYDEASAANAETRLHHLADAYLTFYQDQADYFRLMMAFDRGHFQDVVSPEVYEAILHRSLHGLQWVVRAVEQGAQTGELRAANPQQTAGMIWAAINGVLVLMSHPLRRALLGQDMKTLYTGVLSTMLDGIKTSTSQPQTSKDKL